MQGRVREVRVPVPIRRGREREGREDRRLSEVEAEFALLEEAGEQARGSSSAG